MFRDLKDYAFHFEKKLFLQLGCTFLTLSVILLNPKEQEIFSFEGVNALRKLIYVMYIINDLFFSSRGQQKINKI